MVRTQIQITEEQAAALKDKSVLLGVSMAELIRRGIDQVLESNGGSSHQDQVRRAVQAAGRFRSGLHDVSTNHDKYLAEAYRR